LLLNHNLENWTCKTLTLENNLPNWFESVKPNFSLLPNDVPMLVLQVGVYTGDCTEYLLKNHDIKKIVDVDTWEGSMEMADMNINFDPVEEIYDRKFKDDQRVVKVKSTSDIYFAQNSMSENFDFIYIDGAHTSTQVLLDGINGFANLKVGGILAFDDYEWPMYEGTLLNPKHGIDCWLKLFDGYYELLLMNQQVWVRKLKDI